MIYFCKYRLFIVMVSIMTFSVVQAAVPWDVSHVSFRDLKHVIAVNSTSSAVQSFAFPNQLQPLSEHVDGQGRAHVRLQQYYAGFPVWGGYVVLHHPAGKIKAMRMPVLMNGLIYRGIDQELGDPPPDFVSRGQIALNRLKARYAKAIVSEGKVRALVYVDTQQQSHWVYQVSILVKQANSIPQRPTRIIDAITFDPLLTWDDIKTLKNNVKGQGFGGNSHIGKAQYGQERPFLAVMRDPFMKLCTLENQHVSVWDMGSHTNGQGRLFSFNCDASTETYWTGVAQDGYDQVNGAYSPSNDALYIGTLVYDMYANWYEVSVLGTLKKPMKLIMCVHYGEGFENAFWDGRRMTFGDGGTTFYPLVVLSVGAHEMSHGFTDQYSDLVYMGQSGGMNEAFSDMAAQAVEYYAETKNSWMIGTEIMKEASGLRALRYMKNPTQDGQSIDRADKYYQGMDVHHSSGVYNRFFYLLANHPGWDTRQAFHVMLKANMDYWIPTSTFHDGACGVLSAAEDLGLPLEGIHQSFSAVAVNTADC